MKVCAGIILYNPDIERLVMVVNAISPQVDKLVLVDNASANINEVQSALASERYVWIKNDANLGVARALNQLMEFADSNSFEWMLTLDQDGICDENYVEKLSATINSNDDKINNIAMIAPLIIDRGEVGSEIKSTAPTGKPLPETEDVSFCITSGSLTNVKSVLAIGGFNEWLFIDEVDREICLRLLQNGYKLVRVNTVELCHEHGLKTITRKVLWKKVVYHNYTPFRVYYQTRNLVYMLRKYGSAYYPQPYKRWFRLFFAFCVKFVNEPDRIQRLKAFCRGLREGMAIKL
ncbi:MAG: glycosyltransferase family 2 protein [Oscillospiraceae bacterium]|nr:glycosyltransferase family 2 protein [Oscillospiraceae bacterium]